MSPDRLRRRACCDMELDADVRRHHTRQLLTSCFKYIAAGLREYRSGSVMCRHRGVEIVARMHEGQLAARTVREPCGRVNQRPRGWRQIDCDENVFECAAIASVITADDQRRPFRSAKHPFRDGPLAKPRPCGP